MIVERRDKPPRLRGTERILYFVDKYFSKKERDILIAERWQGDKLIHFYIDVATFIRRLAHPDWFFIELPESAYSSQDFKQQVIVFPPEKWQLSNLFNNQQPLSSMELREIYKQGGEWGIAKPYQWGNLLPTRFPLGFTRGTILWTAKADFLDELDSALRWSTFQNPDNREGFKDELLESTQFYLALLPDHSMKGYFLSMPVAGMKID